MTLPIPFNRVGLEGDENAYMLEAVARGHLSGDGDFTKRCQKLLETLLGVPRALLVTSCTHALEMAALLLEIQPGDEVIVPSFTFVSTVNAFVLRGARPVFVDVHETTLNLDERLLESRITPRTRAIVPVHYAGVGCEMDSILEIAARHGVPVVEDNAHGLFGDYRGKRLGTFGALATQSFHETKNFTCGEGGALLVNEPRFVERAEIIREKGTNRSRFFRGQIDKYTWVDLGSSYVLSDILAAFLLAQLEARERIQSKRRRIWERYRSELAPWARERGVRLPFVPEHCAQPYHMFYLLLPSLAERTAFLAHLKARGILSVFHYLPLHLSENGPALRRPGGRLPRDRGRERSPRPLAVLHRARRGAAGPGRASGARVHGTPGRMSESGASGSRARWLAPALAALEVLLTVLLLAAAIREHGGQGIERDLVAFGLLVAPAHLRRLAALLGRASPAPAWLLALELAAMGGLAAYPVASWGVALAFAVALGHALEAGDATAPLAPLRATRSWLDLAAALLLALTALVLGREAAAAQDLPVARLVLFLPVVAEALLGSRDRSEAAALRRASACLALLGATCVQSSLADLLPWAASSVTAATASLHAIAGRSRQSTEEVSFVHLARELAGATLLLAILGPWLTADGGPGARAFAAALALLPLPGALTELGAPGARRLARGLGRILVAGGLSWAALGAILYVVAGRPSIGGVDFYYYFCAARDRAAGSTVPSLHYSYFPGVYTFWKAAILVTGGSLASAQWTYVAVLGLDAALVAAIVGRATRSVPAALFAALWTGVMASHLDLFEGCTEPLALVPALAAILVWNGARLEGRAGAARALVLGTGLGLALYSRQQAGLLSLGWLSILVSLPLTPPGRRHRLGLVFLVPLAAIVTVGVGIAAEGQGLVPLRTGLQFVVGSVGGQLRTAGASKNTLLENASAVARLLREVPSFAAAAGLTLAVGVAWLAARKSARLREVLGEPGEPASSLVGFAAGAGLATFLQLAKLPYRHYLLLGAPFFAIAATIGASRLLRPASGRRGALRELTALGLAAILLARTDGDPACFHAWPDVPGRAVPPCGRWEREPEIARELSELARLVHPGEELLVWPPGKNAVHYLLGTHSHAYPQGYGWAVDLGDAGLRWEELDAVVLLPPATEPERVAWAEWQSEAFVRGLASHGLHEVARLPRMTLWRRER